MKTKKQFLTIMILLAIGLSILTACNFPTQQSAVSSSPTPFNIIPTGTNFQPNTPAPGPYAEVVGEIVFSKEKVVVNMTFFPSANLTDPDHKELISWNLQIDDKYINECSGAKVGGNVVCTGPGTQNLNTIILYIDGESVSLTPYNEGVYRFDFTVIR